MGTREMNEYNGGGESWYDMMFGEALSVYVCGDQLHDFGERHCGILGMQRSTSSSSAGALTPSRPEKCELGIESSRSSTMKDIYTTIVKCLKRSNQHF